MPSIEDVYLVPGLGHVLQSYMDVKDRFSMEMTSKEMKQYHPNPSVLDTDTFSDDPLLVARYLSKRGHELREVTMKTNVHNLVLPCSLDCMPNVKKITYAVPLYITTETKSIDYATIQCWQSVEKFLDILMTTDHMVEEFNVIPGEIIFRTTVAKNIYEDSPMNMTSSSVHSTLYTHLRNYPLVREPLNQPKQTALKKVRICLSMLSPKACFYLRKFTTVSDWGFANGGDSFFLQHF